MRTARWVVEPGRLASAGLLLAALAIGVGACSGPPSHDPSPKKWDENDGQQRSVAQPPGDSEGSEGSEGSGDSEGGNASVELCAELDAATVQQAFEAPEEPSATAGEEAGGLQDLTVLGGCTYEWGGGDVAGSLTVTAAVAESSDDAETYLESQTSTAGLSGEPIDGFGDASLLDASGSVQSDAAVAIGARDLEGTKTVIVLVGPLDADSAAYAEVGSTVMDSVAQG